jgi:uncharacterized protein (TIGR02598 family)
MKAHARSAAGFSLVEVTLALGVAAFCLITVFGLIPVALMTQQASVRQTTATAIISQIVGDLGSGVRLPPGLQSKQFSLTGHWAAQATPDRLYFMTDGTFIVGSTNQSTVPTNAVFGATVTYLKPPTETTSLADINVAWPAQAAVPTGSVETFAAINRQ